MSRDFATMFKNASYKINYVPMDSRERTSRWYGNRKNTVINRDFTIEEIENIIRSGEIAAIRELSRYFYRTNA